MRVVIAGAGGQLGRDLSLVCGRAGDEVIAVTRAELDITDGDAVREAITAANPDVVVNCAAWTAVDACEGDPHRADAINGHAVGALAAISADLGAHLVQVSTDYVFDGTKRGAYSETDDPAPMSAYGRSKLLGEQLAGTDAAIVRTSWVCSAHGNNMVATIARLAGTHDTLRFVDDQRGRPTFTTDLAVALRLLAADRQRGIFHVANAGETSWFGFAQSVLDALGEDPARVLPIATADLAPPRPAPRPANSVLSTARYDEHHPPLRHYRDALVEVIDAYR